MFNNGFPEMILNDILKRILPLISYETYGDVFYGFADSNNSENEIYALSDGEEIRFPYRVYYLDDESIYSKITNDEERLVYDCIFSRSCNGYIREKHIIRILNSDYPEWCMPYILRLSSEYVVEIVERIYEIMKDKDNTAFQMFCHNNPVLLKRAYTRMVSYWNEFYRYRKRYCKFDSYVGTKLFKECFCPNNNFEKIK